MNQGLAWNRMKYFSFYGVEVFPFNPSEGCTES